MLPGGPADAGGHVTIARVLDTELDERLSSIHDGLAVADRTVRY